MKLDFMEVIFQQIPYDEILNSKRKPGDPLLNSELFHHFSKPYMTNRTTEEIQSIYQLMVEERKLLPNLEHLTLVIELANKFLTFDGNKIQCRYLELLRWRKLSYSLGDDLFTTAFLAYQDYLHNNTSDFFAWPSIISTDNSRLQAILNQGIAENHHHLNGSTQIFPVSWAALMNQVTERKEEFKEFDHILHPKPESINKSKQTLSLHDQILIAADIRLELFKKIQGMKTNTEGVLNNYQKSLKLGTYLQAGALQYEISNMKQLVGAETSFGNLDYTFTKKLISSNTNDNRMLVGERYFLYQCFKQLLMGKFNKQELQLFYAYLLLKNNFRQELIQTNELVGFANFKAYQDRKSTFVDSKRYSQYRHEQVRLALNATLADQAIESFETRIGPKEKGKTLKEELKKYEDAYYHSDDELSIDELLGGEKKSKWTMREAESRHFYVLHFPKFGKEYAKGSLEDYIYCRDAKIRHRVKKQTEGIRELMQTNSHESRLVRGIDTCSTEIDYRPEIFAESFRELRNHYLTTSKNQLSGLGEATHSQQLRATNHSGEDFMDILDGLRAIDETIMFCEFVRGDRLGHALALGLNAVDYYKFKAETVISTKQDTLDDLSWALYKSDQLGVAINSTLRARIKREAIQLLLELYGEDVNLYDYQQAWLLRGDSPELYRENLDKKELTQRSFESFSEQCLTKQSFSKGRVGEQVRGNSQYRKIYQRYHYNGKTKLNGQDKYMRKVTHEEALWITRLQDGMQKELMEKGIAIECNPSSNYLISSFKRYDKHPIFRFNSTGLNECLSPLSVSINTDDQGVFDTTLENEYALLAISLEKAKDDEGNRLYTPEAIYSWLDYVRKLGLQQSFKSK